MDFKRDLYTFGNDYHPGESEFGGRYTDGRWTKIYARANKRVYPLPQDEWRATENGYVFSPDYSTAKTSELTVMRWSSDSYMLNEMTDGWLSAIEYDGYDYELGYRFVHEHFWKIAGAGYMGAGMLGGGKCSSFQTGFIRGRNYDWFYNNSPTILIRTKAVNGRHATIGFAAGIRDLDKNMVLSRKFSTTYKILPFLLLDGVNDAGLVVNLNVAQTVDDDGNIEITNITGKNGPAISCIMLPRYLLDHCATVDEVKAFIDSNDIYAAVWDNMMEEFHIMVTDASGKTIVVDFKDNRPVYTESRIMTNYKLCNDLTRDYGAGHERTAIMERQIDGVTDIDSALKVMESVWYSKAYVSFKEQSNPMWYSECNGKGVFESGIPFDLHQGTPKEDYAYVVGKMIELYDSRSRDTGKTWQTVHTSIYDMKNKKLAIVVQEDMSTRIDLDFGF